MIRYHASPADTAKPSHPPPMDCRTALINRMADDMREMAFAGGGASVETLSERGWSVATIKRLGPTAVAKARRTSIRRVS